MVPHATYVRLCRARDLLRDCHHEPLALANVAAEAGLSPWHFHRLFRGTFRETPHEFLTRLRIERAKDLLTVGSRSVTDICLDVGFTSLGSFGTLFACQVGLSPVAYRRQVHTLVTVPGTFPWGVIPFCSIAMAHRASQSPNSKIREAPHACPKV
jgi:AraC-like DNA-binding protein